MPLSPESQSAFCDAVDALDACVRATPADQWGQPSPCEGWDASDVLAHCVANLRALQGAAEGIDFMETSARPIDGDLVNAWSTAAPEAKTLVASGTLETLALGGREAPAAALVDGLMRDMVIHTWDIDQAACAETNIAAPLLVAAIDAMGAVGPNARRPGMYGAELTAPAGSDDLTRLLGLSGRQAW